jgi:transposase
MAAAIGVRGDYDAARLRELAKWSEDANQTRRLLALAAIYDGESRTDAARIGGVGLQTVRDWVLAFNAEGPAGLVNGKAPGNTPLLTQAHRQALREIVESGPIPAVHGVVRWRLIDLAQWVFEEFRISISKQTLSRELRALELRKLSARPRHHAQDAEAMAAFKKLRREPRPDRPARRGGQADRGLVRDAMRADTGRAECSDWPAFATKPGSLSLCRPRTSSTSPSNSVSHHGLSQRACPAPKNRGCTASKGATRRRCWR